MAGYLIVCISSAMRAIVISTKEYKQKNSNISHWVTFVLKEHNILILKNLWLTVLTKQHHSKADTFPPLFELFAHFHCTWTFHFQFHKGIMMQIAAVG